MSRTVKIGLVAGGYALAFLVASAALAVRLATTNTADAQAAGGMYAFGDLATFVGVFFIAALPASGAALFFVRSHRGVWTGVATIGMAIAITGVASFVAYFAGRHADSDTVLGSLAGLAPLRMLAAPLFALAFFMSAFLAPNRGARVTLLVAAGFEAIVTACTGLFWFGPFHLQ